MKVTVKYLGAFADAAHAKEATYELAAPSVEALIDQLLKAHGEKFRALLLDSETGSLRGGITLLVNGQGVRRDHVLSEDDEVTFLTPVAGG